MPQDRDGVMVQRRGRGLREAGSNKQATPGAYVLQVPVTNGPLYSPPVREAFCWCHAFIGNHCLCLLRRALD